MLRRLLIANRGEIACRIVRTARRLGLTTIAVYSDADRGAQHAQAADEAYHLGGSAASESYLSIDRIVSLARKVGADAVHPGYGFLSENADFADACAAAGLIFVGPPGAAIRAMGSKSASKAAMAAVGVPVAPGYHGEDQSPVRLAEEASRVGFPLIIKASAGGGGKGMQVVSSPAEVGAALDSARRLARTAFGDDRVLLERYFPKARHVEVQVFADAHGGIVSLFDRDCSVQRRHQKIIEEAPAPGLRDQVRADMARAAIQAARAVGYVGAGTVEFLVDEAQSFYFMEMNTRLQVEHPVTEMITGIDLVEWQIRIARGERLPKSQDAIPRRGAAMEARLYAEDPARGYLPSVGRIAHLAWPPPAEGLRLDAGFEVGDEISSFYDPMLGKLIAWGGSRTEATDRLRRALEALEIAGVTTNRALLISVLSDEVFREGGVATDYLVLREAHLRFGEPAPVAEDAVIAALWYAARSTGENALWADSRGWRLGAPAASVWRFGDFTVRLRAAGDAFEAEVGGRERQVCVVARDAGSLTIEIEGRSSTARMVERDDTLEIYRAGAHVTLRLSRTDDALQAGEGGEEGSLLTPLPGTIVAVHVAKGDRVERGAPLVTVEAMKMEHTLTAPHAGVVERLPFGLKERVPAGAVLVELAPLKTP